MRAVGREVFGRRGILAGFAAAGVMGVLAGCMSTTGGAVARADSSPEELVRTLLVRATGDAFARLSAPNGFWNSDVARISLPVLFGKTPETMTGPLASPEFRIRLQQRLNAIATEGAGRAATRAEGGVRRLRIPDASAILAGDHTAATTLLREGTGPALVNVMISPLYRALQRAQDPLIAEAIAALEGIDLRDVAVALANEAENAIWYEIGAAEGAIRRNPEATGDPALIAALSRR